MPDDRLPISVDVTPGERLFGAIRRAPDALARNLRRGLLAYLRRFVSPAGTWQKAWMSGRPGVFRRSGDLARSFEAQDESSGSGLAGIQARAFTRSRYARIQELGGVIVPKQGTLRRVTLKGGRFAKHGTAGARVIRQHYPLLTWKGPDGRWHSSRRVVIPARLHFMESFARDEGGRSRMLDVAIAKTLGDELGGAAASGAVRKPVMGPLEAYGAEEA